MDKYIQGYFYVKTNTCIILVILILIVTGVVIILNNNNEVVVNIEDVNGKFNTIVNMCNAKDMEIPIHESVNLLILNEIELDFNNSVVLYLQLERENYGCLIGHPDFSGLVYLPDELVDNVKEIF